MNITSENRTLIYGIAAGVLFLLLILLLALRSKSKKRNQMTTINASASAITSEGQEQTESAPAQVSARSNPPAHTDAPPTFDASLASIETTTSPFKASNEPADSYYHSSAVSSAPEFIELFVVEDPLDGSGYLGTQINRQTSYISDFEIRALINRHQDQLLSEETLRSGFAEKSNVAGKIRTVLFGEVEAISKSAAAFHPEISDRIVKANNDSANFRLLAIDGLVYGVFLIGYK